MQYAVVFVDDQRVTKKQLNEESFKQKYFLQKITLLHSFYKTKRQKKIVFFFVHLRVTGDNIDLEANSNITEIIHNGCSDGVGHLQNILQRF